MFSREIHPQPHSSYGTLTDETPAGGDSSNAIQEPSPLEGEGQGEGVWACPRLGDGEDRLRFCSEELTAAEVISGKGLRATKRDEDRAPKKIVSDPAWERSGSPTRAPAHPTVSAAS